jgi:hypothetical protein
MKRMTLIIASALCMLLATAHAQETQDVDTASNPVRQGDPAVRQSPEQMQENTLRDMIKISADEIPADLQNALKGEDYKGQSKTFYRSKSGDTYLVEVQDGNTTHTYRFDKEGKRINNTN